MNERTCKKKTTNQGNISQRKDVQNLSKNHFKVESSLYCAGIEKHTSIQLGYHKYLSTD